MTAVKSYHTNGIIEAEGFLSDNVQVGNWIFYHDNGKVYTKGQFNNKGISVGIWTEYYLSGQKKYEAISEQGNWFSLRNDKLQILNYWTEQGELLVCNGQGTLTVYFDNGNLKHRSTWAHNLKNGVLQEFYGDGKLNIELNFRNGVRDGEAKIFHNNGNLYIHCFYDNGKPAHSYKEWYKKGQLCEEGFYKNEKYFIDNFWDDAGVQTLFKGNGYVIKKEGADELDMYRQDFENYMMTKETRL